MEKKNVLTQLINSINYYIVVLKQELFRKIASSFCFNFLLYRYDGGK
jgi:hypothetical protein